MDVMVHLSSADIVFDHAAYGEWMRSFGPVTSHVFIGAGAGVGITAFQASTLQTRKYHTLFPQLFPRLDHSADSIREPLMEVEGISWLQGQPAMKFTLIPKSQRGWAPPPPPSNLETEVAAFLGGLSSNSNLSSGTAKQIMENLSGEMESAKRLCIAYGTYEMESLSEADASIFERSTIFFFEVF